jgi:hypothetical protein
MQSIHIRKKLESEHLTLPELRPLIGKQVEITICEAADEPGNGAPAQPVSADRYPLRGTVLRYDDPFGPAADPDDWEACR